MAATGWADDAAFGAFAGAVRGERVGAAEASGVVDEVLRSPSAEVTQVEDGREAHSEDKRDREEHGVRVEPECVPRQDLPQ